jgi:hypothetical protein
VLHRPVRQHIGPPDNKVQSHWKVLSQNIQCAAK